MTIDPKTKVNEIVRRWPETIPVFQKYGLDIC